MNPQPDPAAKFIVSIIANAVRILLTPYYYVARSDMGVQWTALTTLFVPCIIYAAGFFIPATVNASALGWHGQTSRVDVPVIGLYVLLLVLGFIRNTIQAWQRRRLRDWSVHSWSTGRPLLEPVLVLLCRAVYRQWGAIPWVRRVVFRALTDDFIFYVAEPAMLLLGAMTMGSVDATARFYPTLIAVILVVVRSDSQLWLYLKAHEVMDGKQFEQAIKAKLEGRPTEGGGSIPIAEIPLGPAMPATADERTVFDRLSPELQMLLARDRAMQS